MSSSATYTENKNFLSTVTDSAGSTVSYDYNSTTGTMSSTTDAKNNTLEYSYDNNNRVTNIYNGDENYISYNYSNDRLDKITAFGNVAYDFAYDAFGNTTTTRVGNGTDYYTLATNTYDNYGKLTQMTYGNGAYVNYSYDLLDRITEKSYNGSVIATYKYNNNGNLSVFTDAFKNELTRNIYDLSGRLVAANTYSNTTTASFVMDTGITDPNVQV